MFDVIYPWIVWLCVAIWSDPWHLLPFFVLVFSLIILACWEFDSPLCLLFLQFLTVPFPHCNVFLLFRYTCALCTLIFLTLSAGCPLSFSFALCSCILIQIHHQQLLLMSVISQFFVLLWSRVRRCLYVLHPIWMVGGWFVHYGVSVLRCAIFGDFYRIPNLELWIFPFLSLASLAYKCFAALWPILFLRRPGPVPYFALNCDCLSLFFQAAGTWRDT